MEWIKLTEEKPKDNHCSFIITDGQFVGMGYWDIIDFVGGDTADLFNKITHWMPFPKPPVCDE